MQQTDKIYIAGHAGMVGSALVRALKKAGYTNLVTRERNELDLLNQVAVEHFFATHKPAYVFNAAAKVGGIMANNTNRADFISDNLLMQSNIIRSAHNHKVKKLLFLGSSCIYPAQSPQPIKEEYLLTGPLEPTNEPYAIAKIAGLKMCESYRKQYNDDFISAMPTNLYGPNDNFNLENSHVLPALMRKFHEAKTSNSPNVTVWGTGEVWREFLHVDDMAAGCLFLMQQPSTLDWFNVGSSVEVTIKQLAHLVAKTVGFKGELVFDTSKPNGMLRKLMDSSRINSLGWKPTITLEDGLQSTYQWFLAHQDNFRA